jgi:hypothetical protein
VYFLTVKVGRANHIATTVKSGVGIPDMNTKKLAQRWVIISSAVVQFVNRFLQ